MMQAMVLRRLNTALEWTELPDRAPGPGMIRVKVAACGVCRTDLHVVDGELPSPVLPIIPGHEIVGRIDAVGSGVEGLRVGERVGIPWLGHTCGACPYCREQRENLCGRPLFGVLGGVEPRAGGLFAFRIGAGRHLVRKPRDEDLPAAGVVDLRHLIERAGLAPALPASHADPAPRSPPAVPGLLVATDRHGARVFRIDAAAANPARHTIKPCDPHGCRHHLTRKDEPRERGQRAAEDPSCHGRTAHAVMAGARIVVVGHGHGRSDAACHLVEHLQARHRDTYGTHRDRGGGGPVQPDGAAAPRPRPPRPARAGRLELVRCR